MKNYLKSTEFIDWENTAVQKQAQLLSKGLSTDEQIAEACFLFVRDEIKHSVDFQLNPLTAKASDVLKYKTGYCYAKSHLLAALLRACGIPAGLCYQRLTTANNKAPFCLHGLNAVYLQKHGWYRIDSRGNKKGINAGFCPPTEQLAFSIGIKGECDIQGIWPTPLPIIINALERNSTWVSMYENLPDIEIYQV